MLALAMLNPPRLREPTVTRRAYVKCSSENRSSEILFFQTDTITGSFATAIQRNVSTASHILHLASLVAAGHLHNASSSARTQEGMNLTYSYYGNSHNNFASC